MRRLGLTVLLAAVSVGVWAQAPDEEILSKEEIVSRISALEAQVAPHLDTVTAVVFKEEYITRTLWVNDFADMMAEIPERPMDTAGWEETLAWLLPESDRDTAELAEASAAGIYIDVKADGNVYNKYVQMFKSHGFNNEAKETEMSGMEMFEARNAKGDRQCAVVDMGGGRLSVSVEAVKTDAEIKTELKQRTGEAQREAKEAEYEELMKQFL